MMAKKEHKYAQVLRWIADGEKVQFRDENQQHLKDWDLITIDLSCIGLIQRIFLEALPVSFEFRLAPRTIRVNGVEVPAPVNSEEYAEGVEYYVSSPSSVAFYFQLTQMQSIALNLPGKDRDNIVKHYIESGLVYLAAEDAIARAKAMLMTQDAT